MKDTPFCSLPSDRKVSAMAVLVPSGVARLQESISLTQISGGDLGQGREEEAARRARTPIQQRLSSKRAQKIKAERPSYQGQGTHQAADIKEKRHGEDERHVERKSVRWAEGPSRST